MPTKQEIEEKIKLDIEQKFEERKINLTKDDIVLNILDGGSEEKFNFSVNIKHLNGVDGNIWSGNGLQLTYENGKYNTLDKFIDSVEERIQLLNKGAQGFSRTTNKSVTSGPQIPLTQQAISPATQLNHTQAVFAGPRRDMYATATLYEVGLRDPKYSPEVREFASNKSNQVQQNLSATNQNYENIIRTQTPEILNQIDGALYTIDSKTSGSTPQSAPIVGPNGIIGQALVQNGAVHQITDILTTEKFTIALFPRDEQGNEIKDGSAGIVLLEGEDKKLNNIHVPNSVFTQQNNKPYFFNREEHLNTPSDQISQQFGTSPLQMNMNGQNYTLPITPAMYIESSRQVAQNWPTAPEHVKQPIPLASQPPSVQQYAGWQNSFPSQYLTPTTPGLTTPLYPASYIPNQPYIIYQPLEIKFTEKGNLLINGQEIKIDRNKNNLIIVQNSAQYISHHPYMPQHYPYPTQNYLNYNAGAGQSVAPSQNVGPQASNNFAPGLATQPNIQQQPNIGRNTPPTNGSYGSSIQANSVGATSPNFQAQNPKLEPQNIPSGAASLRSTTQQPNSPTLSGEKASPKITELKPYFDLSIPVCRAESSYADFKALLSNMKKMNVDERTYMKPIYEAKASYMLANLYNELEEVKRNVPAAKDFTAEHKEYANFNSQHKMEPARVLETGEYLLQKQKEIDQHLTKFEKDFGISIRENISTPEKRDAYIEYYLKEGRGAAERKAGDLLVDVARKNQNKQQSLVEGKSLIRNLNIASTKEDVEKVKDELISPSPVGLDDINKPTELNNPGVKSEKHKKRNQSAKDEIKKATQEGKNHSNEGHDDTNITIESNDQEVEQNSKAGSSNIITSIRNFASNAGKKIKSLFTKEDQPAPTDSKKISADIIASGSNNEEQLPNNILSTDPEKEIGKNSEQNFARPTEEEKAEQFKKSLPELPKTEDIKPDEPNEEKNLDRSNPPADEKRESEKTKVKKANPRSVKKGPGSDEIIKNIQRTSEVKKRGSLTPSTTPKGMPGKANSGKDSGSESDKGSSREY